MTHHIWIQIIIIVLGLIQIYQWKVLYSLKKENDQIWDQIKMLTKNIASELLDLKSAIDEKKSIKKKTK